MFLLLLHRNNNTYSMNGSRNLAKYLFVRKLVFENYGSDKTIFTAFDFHDSAQPVRSPDFLAVSDEAYIVHLNVSVALEPLVTRYQ